MIHLRFNSQPDKVLTDTVHVRDRKIKRYDGVLLLSTGYANRQRKIKRYSQPDKVLTNTVHGWDAKFVEYWLCHYRCLEEINCNIDCEGSSLSEVEQMEVWIRQAAARHPRRPKLLAMNRINQDKMVMDDRS